MEIVAIVPVKEFSKAKTRLAKVLSREARIELSKAMLKDVILALASNCEVKQIIITTPNKDMNEITALSSKIKVLHDNGVGQLPALRKSLNYVLNMFNPNAILITVADLPSIKPWDISHVIHLAQTYNSVVLAPSADGGTNIMIQHPPAIINLKYGPMSFRKHVEEARKKKIFVKTYLSETTLIDLDTPEDLKQVVNSNTSYNTSEVLKKLRKEHGL